MRVLARFAVVMAIIALAGCGRPAPTELESLEASVDSATTSTPASSTTSTTAAPPTTVQPEYIIQEGDSLSIIAERFGVTTEALADFNGISDVNAIVVGQRLTIPPATPPSD